MKFSRFFPKVSVFCFGIKSFLFFFQGGKAFWKISNSTETWKVRNVDFSSKQFHVYDPSGQTSNQKCTIDKLTLDTNISEENFWKQKIKNIER